MHTLIICPLKKEVTYLIDAFTKAGWNFESHQTPRLSLYRSKNITVAQGGRGKVQFALQTQHLLHHLEDVSQVFCIGAGGGLAPQVKVGDLVIGEKTLEHDYREKFNLLGRLPEFIGHSRLLQQRVKGMFHYEVHRGIIASGDEDIVDAKRAKELFEQTKALAVAWEGSGGARACAFNKIPFLEIRAITDNARESVADSFIKNLPICMHNAADFVLKILLNEKESSSS